MPVIKIPQLLREELEAIGVVVWLAQHPMDHGYEVNGAKGKGRQDKTRVHVQLSGPGMAESSPWGYGNTLRTAVDDALMRSGLRDRVPGLKGAMMRLEGACSLLESTLKVHRVFADTEDEDEIPF